MAIASEAEFMELVKKAELDAEANRGAYLRKLALFAMLGYLVIFLVLLFLVGLAGGLVALAFLGTGLFLLLLKKKLIFVVLFGIWILLRALWVRFEPPRGYTLERETFPELFAELDALSRQLDSLKIHEVILDRNLNASVLQHPRLGVLGWHRNYLVIGYQLLLTLSPDEMRSVLAHEFGHLSANHSRFNGWIYRVRLSWMRVMSAFDETDSWGGRIMAWFFDWYSPRFEAYSFALARGNEYEADAMSVELTSPEVATSALVNVYTTAPYIDEAYWDNYFRLADDHGEPPYAPFAGLARFLGDNPMARDELARRIETEMAVETHYANTHPSLRDRVAAIGTDARILPASGPNAAEAWLGDGNRTVMADFDRAWMDENLDGWRERHEYVGNARSKLEQYRGARAGDLDDEALWNFAFWTFEFETQDAALPLFRSYQQRYPRDADVAWYIGSILLRQDDATGLEQLRLARENAHYIENCARLGYDYLERNGEAERAEAWWQECLAINRRFIAARAERDSVTDKDGIEAPVIDEDLLQQLLAGLKAHKKVKKAWLAQKTLQHYPEQPVYIVAFAPGWIVFSSDRIQAQVAESLEVPGDFFVVCKSGDNAPIAKKVIKAGTRIL